MVCNCAIFRISFNFSRTTQHFKISSFFESNDSFIDISCNLILYWLLPWEKVREKGNEKYLWKKVIDQNEFASQVWSRICYCSMIKPLQALPKQTATKKTILTIIKWDDSQWNLFFIRKCDSFIHFLFIITCMASVKFMLSINKQWEI